MSKTTPGPWIAQPDPHGGPDDWMVGTDVQADAVCVCSECDAHVLAAAPELLSALRGIEVLYLRDGESRLEQFERVGEAFRAETGFLRPGKDCRLHSLEEREAAWDAWIAAKSAAMRAAILKAEGAQS